MKSNSNFYKDSRGFQSVGREEVLLPGLRRIIVAGDFGCTGFKEENRFVLAQLLRQQGDVLFFLGDLAYTGAAEEFQEIIEFCNCRVQVPIFALCGNHDLPHYKDFFGLSSYTIVIDTFAFIFMDSSQGLFTDKELDHLATALQRHRSDNIIIAMHVPPPTRIERSHLSQKDWEKMKAVLAPHKGNIRQIICSHIHCLHQYELDGYPITITAGGSCDMIYEVKPPAQRIHHCLALDLFDNGEIGMEVIRLDEITANVMAD